MFFFNFLLGVSFLNLHSVKSFLTTITYRFADSNLFMIYPLSFIMTAHLLLQYLSTSLHSLLPLNCHCHSTPMINYPPALSLSRKFHSKIIIQVINLIICGYAIKSFNFFLFKWEFVITNNGCIVAAVI